MSTTALRAASAGRVGTRRPARGWAIGTPVALMTLCLVYLFGLWPWLMTWGTTPAERTRALPGDEIVADANHVSTRAVTVRAPAPVVWQWLVQIGEDRAGFYSYDWLENLFGARIRNADRVRGEWQTLRAGDLVRAVPEGYLGGALDATPGWRVAAVEPGHWFVLRGWGVFLVEPVDAATSRLVVRTRFRDDTWWGPVVNRLAFDPVHFVMERRMLLGIAGRAEGRRTPPAMAALAGAGFALAAAAVAWRFLAKPRRRPWLLLPAGLALAVAWGTGDALAAAAGFTALGLTMLGVARLRRDWPWLLPVPALVLLVLLLARDATLVFGLGFLCVGIVWATWRAVRRTPAAA